MLINKKKIFVYYIVTFFIVLELASFLFIKLYSSYFNKSNVFDETKFFFHKIEHLKSDKYIFNPYINHKKYLSDLDKKPAIYLEGRPFVNFDFNLIENDYQVLFQGDSWNYMNFLGEDIYTFFKNYSVKNNLRIINAGNPSYSPSLYLAQLKILKNYYNLNPKIIVLIIDQTDLGDELYSRTYFPHLVLETFINKLNYTNIIINEFNINSIKLIKILFSELNYQKNNYELDNYLSSFKMLWKRVYAKVFNKPIQLQPLYYGISKNEKESFLNVLNIYYEIANSKDLEKLIIVTHPHKNHLNGKFKLNVSTLIDKFIDELNSNKIYHIDFQDIINNKKLDANKLFLENDIFSHLTQEMYLKHFYKNIFKNLEIQKTLSN